ncbi:precorrin-3B C(17)-methyltransferase [Afifella pfennigii]|uniref:precorrin-3B C(17)-methyltransferase n=1 Tax=Afifella pfennigii TaxID=209897 RepID=UPI0005569022|nr:precorrin-3B C(17)-methyltransferase [Afifella pfennigii]
MKEPVFLALTGEGLKTAHTARASLGGEVHAARRLVETGAGAAHAVFDEAGSHIRELFAAGRAIVGICAAGILIRVLAPLLADKRAEPPVLAVSEDGTSIVPLLGGHRGANEFAERLAGALGGHAALTTAGETRFGIALDAPPEGWSLANPQDAKGVMAALLEGEAVRLEGTLPWLEASGLKRAEEARLRLVATTRKVAGNAQSLVYHPRSLALGVGCERGAETAEVLGLIEASLAAAGLSRGALACLVSIDLKADETAILEAGKALELPVRFFSAARLEEETPRLENPSETVFCEVGCHGVAEGAALAAVGPQGRLVMAKRKSARATCAIAEAPAPLRPERLGRARGRLAVIGIGPGTEDWRTPEAARLISDADYIIGYHYYLDLIVSLIADQKRIDSELGQERERCALALKLAGEGRKVALVSSGDPGIYAMASLVMELVEAAPAASPEKRAEIVVAPGISAFQAAAARIGAPMGHDFCLISLSDLLTPWEAILERVKAAAAGDFVVAFYNPVSKRRRHQLADARDILLQRRRAQTPVLIARQLGRAEERLHLTTLGALKVEDVDMMSLVVVGSSQSRVFRAGGRDFLFTPRGYDRKEEPVEAMAEGAAT